MDERRVGDQLVYITDNTKIRATPAGSRKSALKKTCSFCRSSGKRTMECSATQRRAFLAAQSSFALATELSGRAG